MNYGYYSAEDYYPIESAYQRRTIELFQPNPDHATGINAVPVPVPEVYLMPTMTGNQIMLPSTGAYEGPFSPTFILSPTNVKAVVDKTGNIEVSFNKPTFSQGIDIIGYTVYSIPGNRMEQTTQNSVTFTNMEKNQKYTFVVVAQTTIGNSAPSAPSPQVIVSNSKSTWLIIAIVALSVIVGCLVIYGLYILYSKYKEKHKETITPDSENQVAPKPFLAKITNWIKRNPKPAENNVNNVNNTGTMSTESINIEQATPATPMIPVTQATPVPISTDDNLNGSPVSISDISASISANLNNDIPRT
jgi:hypothetical protein